MALTLRYWGSAQIAAVAPRLKGGQQSNGEVGLSTWLDALFLHSGDIGGQPDNSVMAAALEKSGRASEDRCPLGFLLEAC